MIFFSMKLIKKKVYCLPLTKDILGTDISNYNLFINFCMYLFELSLMEQAPTQMGEEAVRWAKLIIPLVVHSAHKVQLRGAAALEMGMPLLLQKQQEVAAITEHLMSTVSGKCIFIFFYQNIKDVRLLAIPLLCLRR